MGRCFMITAQHTSWKKTCLGLILIVSLTFEKNQCQVKYYIKYIGKLYRNFSLFLLFRKKSVWTLKISAVYHVCETTIEPPRDKTNKMACAPSEDSDQPGHLSAWRKLECLATHWAHNKGSDQMPRLLWVFAGRTVILLVLSRSGSKAT